VSTYVALLRGVNVGGRNKLAMADLRAVVTSLGHTGVATYVQSGNVVFTPADRTETDTETDTDTDALTAVLPATLERAIADSLSVRPSVVVLSCAELAQVVADNPYPEESNPKSLHAVFRAAAPDPAMVATVELAVQRSRQRGSSDDARVVGRTLYLRLPDGLGRSDLAARLLRAGSGGIDGEGTARNWATVRALLAMCSHSAPRA
jgi:Uncharacterized protein conserved in bacteria